MKTIKNTALLLMGVLMMSTTLSAQKKAKLSDDERAAKHVKRLTKKLDLSEKQVVQLEELTASQMSSTQELRDEMKALKEKQKQLREKLKAKKGEHKDQLKAMLDKDQLAKFEEMEKKQAERREKKRGERKGKHAEERKEK